jgi:uncharacterized membrane protein
MYVSKRPLKPHNPMFVGSNSDKKLNEQNLWAAAAAILELQVFFSHQRIFVAASRIALIIPNNY